MHIILHLLLIFALFATAVNSQGARGGGGSRGGAGGGSRFSGGSRGTTRGGSCQGSSCRITWIIVGSVIGGILALIAIIFLTIYCCRKYRARRRQSDYAFLNKGSTNEQPTNYQTYEEDCFKNGYWLGRYHQYGKWHGPHRMSLTFNRTTNGISGDGYDDVGKFIVDGTFSAENQRIAMTKTYELGSGDFKENFGHTVNLQMTWNSKNAQFEGKWLVNTNHYHGEGDFEMKFGETSKPVFEKSD